MSAPPPYRAEDIRTFRSPTLAKLETGWRSVWKIGISETADAARVRALLVELNGRRDVAAKVDAIDRQTMRLVLMTQDHPLDVNSFLEVDRALLDIDAAVGIETINDSPRNHWRTFLRSGRDEPDEVGA